KLGRDVAIKVLPEAFSEDPERFARFEREAQLLAHLNHPNIAAIYDLAEDKGTHFLVLELVEGEDLATRLSRGPIETEDALALALQIAGALEVAHDKGIVHRDLKPSNIMVTPEGQTKVLDFGLAKAFAAGPGEDSAKDLSQSPTMSAQATQAGVILGTAAYMSPEQARGMPVDKRSDIWSFGVVLSEMLSGRSLFRGETLSDTLAAVLRAPIETTRLPDKVGRRVRYLLERCLVRDPSMRLRDIGEARILLSTVGILGDEAKLNPEPRSSRALATAPWAVALAAIIAAFVAWRAPPQVTSPSLRMRFTIDAGYVAGSGVAVSPDGSYLAFRQAQGAFSGSLWVRPLDRFEFSAIPDTENAHTYFWSANGREIAFIKGEELFAHDIAAGTTRQILTGKEPFWGGSWSDQDVILLAMAGSIYRVPASGGTPEVVLAPEEGKTAWHARPSFLPGGERFLFTSEIEEVRIHSN
ncbi:MAG: protein kinase, partial [Acidobacteriota bacterium]